MQYDFLSHCRNKGGELEADEHHDDTKRDGNHVDVEEHLFDVEFFMCREESHAVAPEGEKLDGEECGREDHPFVAQNEGNDGNDEAFTFCPFSTTACAGAPICCTKGMIAFAGKPHAVIG